MSEIETLLNLKDIDALLDLWSEIDTIINPKFTERFLNIIATISIKLEKAEEVLKIK